MAARNDGLLIGRARELEILRALIADVVAGRGRALLVQGEPGIGKTALLSAAFSRADADGCEVLSGTCNELTQRFPLSVMAHALGRADRSVGPARLTVPDERLEEGGLSLRGLSGDPVLATLEQMLVLVDRMCAAKPVVLVVEDLHCADEASLLLWRRLSRASVQLPLLVVGSCRPVPRRDELRKLRREVESRHGMTMLLEGLAEEGVADLAGDLAGGRPGPRLTRRLLQTGGNPLYVRELIDVLARSGELHVGDGTAELVHDNLPDRAVGSLAAAITDRLDFLSRDTVEMLRAAALLGLDFSLKDLATVVGQAPGPLLGQVEEALAAAVLEPVGQHLRFRHGLLREALPEAMATPLRLALSRHAAQMLSSAGAPVEQVAGLLLPALEVETAEGWEVDWLVENAASLLRGAPAATAELLDRTLRQLSADDPRRAPLEDRLTVVWFALARHDRTEQLARDILASSTERKRTSEAVWTFAYTLMRTGRFEEARSAASAAADDARTTPSWRARYTALLAMLAFASGQLEQSALLAARARVAAEEAGDITGLSYALHALSITSRLLDRDNAAGMAYVDRALEAIGEDDHTLTDLRLLMLGNRFVMLTDLNRPAEAENTLATAVRLAERTGTPRLGMLRIHAAQHAFSQGRWDDALAELEAITDLPDQVNHEPVRRMTAASIAMHRGQWAEASRQLRPLRLEDPAMQQRRDSREAWLTTQALLAERAGRPNEVLSVLSSLLTPQYADLENRFQALPALVRAALQAGDGKTAREGTEEARLESEREPLPRKTAAAAWCRGLLHGDSAEVAASAAYYRDAGQQLESGQALEDAAALTATAGRLEPARTLLIQALETYSALGARWDAQRATTRLYALGVRVGISGPRKRPLTGWQALTATELRIAELVSAGRSNPDIAAELLLSRRTVETHVSHILAKLRISSRREIALSAPAQS